ncbi:MAG TPA: VTC domain-containing protein, partial [Solirubrobacteraceae bacterium]|nr:VTC domain-containing protein [Solirubrobacteraceae bacterium]
MTTAAELAAPLPSISLAALEERAALQTRRDRKYIVAIDTLTELVSALEQRYAALEIAARRVFCYDSVYFDSDCRACYRAHIQG